MKPRAASRARRIMSEARTHPRSARALALTALCVGIAIGTSRLGAAPQEEPASRPAPVTSQSLTVYATGQSLGSLEPCECVEGMAGGFPRRLALLAREAQLRRGPSLVVDLGDLTGKDFHPRLLEAKTRAALELLAKTEALVAVGDLDLRLEPEVAQVTQPAPEVRVGEGQQRRPAASQKTRTETRGGPPPWGGPRAA